MAFLEFNNVRVAGISAGVPKRCVDNLDGSNRISKEYDNTQFVKETGVRCRRIDSNLTTSDLGFPAAKKLIDELNWNPKDIGAIILVTQFPDFIAPSTACIIQDKLGCSKECLAYDIELGCSGWIYGLATVASFMQSGSIKKALLIAGDGRWNYENAEDFSGALFGHAATATALEYSEGCESLKFHLGTDGSGYRALWVPGGGARNPFNSKSLEVTVEDDEKFTQLTSRMNGMDVFSFGITTAPKSIKRLSEHFGKDYSKADYYVFHQANMMMNQMIAKKLRLDSARIPVSMDEFGNTSSASIPLTIVTRLNNILPKGKYELVCCGFGIGLSWGSVYLPIDNITIPPLVDVESDEHML